MARLLRSVAGTFAARAGLSLFEFLGILYVAAVAGPATLGTFVLFRAVVVVVSVLTDLGTRSATKKRIAERTAQGEFLAVSFLTRATLLVPVAAVVLAAGGPLGDYVGSPLTVPFLVGIAALDVVVQTVDAGLHGEQRVGRAETALFTMVAAKVVVWVAALEAGFGLVGLLAGMVVGRVVQLGVGLRFLSIRPRRPGREHLRSLLRFSRYSWLGAVHERAWIWTDALVLGFFVAADVVGVYELSWQLSAGFFLVASAISSTLFANVDRLMDEGGPAAVRDALEESLVYTGVAAIPGVVGGLVLGTSLLATAGSSYTSGYLVLVVLIVARLAHCYEVVFAKVLTGLDRPDLTFRANAAFVGLNVVGNVLAVATVGWVGAAFATAAAMLVQTFLTYRYLWSLVVVPFPRREVRREVLAALAMGGVLLAVTGGHRLAPLPTAGAVALGGVVYGLTLLVTVARIRLRVRDLVLGLV